MVEVHIDTRTYMVYPIFPMLLPGPTAIFCLWFPPLQVKSNLTHDAMAAALALGAFSSPVFLHSVAPAGLPIPASSTQQLAFAGPTGFASAVLQAVARDTAIPLPSMQAFREVCAFFACILSVCVGSWQCAGSADLW